MSCEVKHPTPRSIALPVVNAPKPLMPRSRMGWKRAIVLGSVQFLMIAHVVQWLWFGRTLSPVEPSESMATLKDGIVNAGTVLFALALVSTLVLGRWFCGWGCHVLMLQDLCRWMLGKLGIRPRPFRSRLLMFVPLALALYMFVWPVVYRVAIAPYVRPDLKWPGFTTHFVTTDFWQSMPGVLMAIPFFGVCGFLTVYLLGAKGYCTYGCPYGGFFAPLDEFAIGRIRVTSDCEHCGHCTAVCTSNVRVHEEVRDYGMVVDPGCMKCMDCVSTCPNDALYFGFGAPAALTKPRVVAPTTRTYDLTLREEFAFACVAVVVFVSVRGTFGVVLPLLFASGLTACLTFIAWKAWRTLRDENVNFHRWRLRSHGTFRIAGMSWIAVTSVALLLSLSSATVNVMGFAAAWLDDRVKLPPEMVFSGNPVALDPPLVASAERALSLYGAASHVSNGGIAILPVAQGAIDLRRAWLLSCLGRFDDAERLLRGAIERDGVSEWLAVSLGRVLRGTRRVADAKEWYASTTAAHPDWRDFQEEYVLWLALDGTAPEAIAAASDALARRPNELMYMRRLSLALMQLGAGEEIEQGIRLTQRTLEIAPNNPFAYRAMSDAYFRLERIDESEAAMRKAAELAPDDWRLMQAFGERLIAIGKTDEGAPILREAKQRGMSNRN